MACAARPPMIGAAWIFRDRRSQPGSRSSVSRRSSATQAVFRSAVAPRLPGALLAQELFHVSADADRGEEQLEDERVEDEPDQVG